MPNVLASTSINLLPTQQYYFHPQPVFPPPQSGASLFRPIPNPNPLVFGQNVPQDRPQVFGCEEIREQLKEDSKEQLRVKHYKQAKSEEELNGGLDSFSGDGDDEDGDEKGVQDQLKKSLKTQKADTEAATTTQTALPPK